MLSPSALESALRNRGALGSVPESALEGALPLVLYTESTLESTFIGLPETGSARSFFFKIGVVPARQSKVARGHGARAKLECKQ